MLIPLDGKKAVSVSAGTEFTAAITEDGSLYTWGANGKGQLGDGSVTAKSTPVRITLGSGESVSRVSAGNYHTASVTESGSLYVWGANDFSQIGDPDAFSAKTPTLISLDGKKVTDVSLGALHSAALTEDRSVYTWGCNDNGQLGDGTTDEQDTPAVVNIGAPVSAIALGADHSAAIDENGTLYMLGCNDAG